MEKQRELLWDVLKGMAIMMVVLGHSIQFCSGELVHDSGDYWDNRLLMFMYSFHMPLFMIICGYFCYRSIKKNKAKEFVLSKLNQLVLPVFTYFIVTLFVQGVPDASGFSLLSKLIIRFITSLWFLWGVFIFSLLLYCANHYKINNWLLLTLCIIVLIFTPDFPATTAYVKSVFPAFMIGVFVREYKWYDYMLNKLPLTTITSGIVFGILLCFYNRDCYVYTTFCSAVGGVNRHNNLYNIYIGF